MFTEEDNIPEMNSLKSLRWEYALMLCKKMYKIDFLKKSAKINKEAYKKHIAETLKSFGGISLLSSVTILIKEDCIAEISCFKDSIYLVDAALAFSGICNEMKCAIREYK